MKITKVIRGEKFVTFHHEVQGHLAIEEREITCKEAPLSSFDEALQNLKEVAITILGAPRSWLKDITITGLSISHTKRGTRSLVIRFDRFYQSVEKTKAEATPMFQIDNPSDGEEGRPNVVKMHAEMCAVMIAEAERYAAGERQQVLLPLEEAPEKHEPRDGDEMDFSKESDSVTGQAPSEAEPSGEEETFDWSDVPIPNFADTTIPEFSKMETAHALWYIDRQESAEDLRSEIQYNFDKVVHHRTGLEKLKTIAKELILSIPA